MTLRRQIAVVMVAMLAGSAGCAGSLPVVEVAGTPANLSALAGEWAGEYASDGSDDRRGSIFFALVAGEDHAHGDVLMTPSRMRLRFPRGSNPIDSYDERGGPSEFRAIRFVRAEGSSVEGALDLYWDDEHSSWAVTIFEGRVVEDTIRGRFRTRFSRPLSDIEGWWRVTRRALTPSD